MSAGISATFTGFSDLTDVQVGDAVAITRAVNNDVTNFGTITAVGAGSVTATMNTACVAESGIEAEIGPDFGSVLSNLPPHSNRRRGGRKLGRLPSDWARGH